MIELQIVTYKHHDKLYAIRPIVIVFDTEHWGDTVVRIRAIDLPVYTVSYVIRLQYKSSPPGKTEM
jgi:hypothetical protein